MKHLRLFNMWFCLAALAVTVPGCYTRMATYTGPDTRHHPPVRIYRPVYYPWPVYHPVVVIDRDTPSGTRPDEKRRTFGRRKPVSNNPRPGRRRGAAVDGGRKSKAQEIQRTTQTSDGPRQGPSFRSQLRSGPSRRTSSGGATRTRHSAGRSSGPGYSTPASIHSGGRSTRSSSGSKSTGTGRSVSRSGGRRR